MIQAISLRNFKRFGDRRVTIPLAPLTLLLGQNSSGKSTVFQALLALQQTWEAHAGSLPQIGRLDLQGSRVRLGNFGNVVHGQDASRSIEIGIRGDNAWTFLRYQADARSPWATLRSLSLQRGAKPPLELTVIGKESTAEQLVLAVDLDTVATVIDQEKLATDIAGRQAPGLQPISVEIEAAAMLEAIGRANIPSSVAAVDEAATTVGPEPAIECRLLSHEVRFTTIRFPESTHPWGTPPDYPAKSDVEGADALCRLLHTHFDRTLFPARDIVLGLSHIGSARTPCPRVTELESDLDAACGSRGERAGSLLLANPWIEGAVNNRLEQLGLRYRVAVSPMGKTATSGAIVLESGLTAVDHDSAPTDKAGGEDARAASAPAQQQRGRAARVQVSVEDVGYGVGQLLPILVEQARLTGQAPEMATWRSDSEVVGRLSTAAKLHMNVSTLLVEQPELHLHPALQADVASILAGLTQEDPRARRKRTPGAPQVLAETHSEHMVLRAQRLVREDRLAPHDASLVFVSTRDDGSAHAQQIPLTSEGEFERPWPGGFFPERYEEL